MESSLTVVIPVKDGKDDLQYCLASIPNELIRVVVGSGPGDSSQAIAQAVDADYLQFDWDGRFPKKRNWVLRNYQFETEWVLFLDADEYPTPTFWEELSKTLPTTKHNGFWLRYQNHFMGKRLRHGDPCPKLALFRVGTGEYEYVDEEHWSHLDMEVHEHPIIQGSIGEISASIVHRDYRGLSHWIRKHNEYAEWEAKRYLQLASATQNEWRMLTSRQQTKYKNISKCWFAVSYFIWVYFFRRGFMDGFSGFHVAFLKSWYFYTIRLKIREIQAF